MKMCFRRINWLKYRWHNKHILLNTQNQGLLCNSKLAKLWGYQCWLIKHFQNQSLQFNAPALDRFPLLFRKFPNTHFLLITPLNLLNLLNKWTYSAFQNNIITRYDFDFIHPLCIESEMKLKTGREIYTV